MKCLSSGTLVPLIPLCAGFAQIEATLPFAVEKHPSSKSPVAKEMLRRLKEDVQFFATEVHSVCNVLISASLVTNVTGMRIPGSVVYPVRSSPPDFDPVVSVWQRSLRSIVAFVCRVTL